jgi:23S rRNA pseudouridine2605 synthase
LKLRLNKYLSMCGVASRRKADELIASGGVRINGVVEKELGRTIDPEKDRVEIGGLTVTPETHRYLVLNKPRLFVTAIGEGQDEKRTIDELISDVPERVYPVGRLDYDVEGLIILTNDGELANRILHPRYELLKVYRAVVRGDVAENVVKSMSLGAELEDGPAKPDSIKIIERKKGFTTFEIAFHEGRNHLVKRFFEAFGHKIWRLKRIAVGPVELGGLQLGKWRNMREPELRALRGAAGRKK